MESVFGNSNWLTDPDIFQGLSTLFGDLSTGTSNPVTDPIVAAERGRAAAHQQRRRVERGRHRANGRHGQRGVGAEQRRHFTALTDLEDTGRAVLYAFLNGYPKPLAPD